MKCNINENLMVFLTVLIAFFTYSQINIFSLEKKIELLNIKSNLILQQQNTRHQFLLETLEKQLKINQEFLKAK